MFQVCDDVMETAWSTMWNVTDETPVNCERFLNGGGMYLFLKCKVPLVTIFFHVLYSMSLGKIPWEVWLAEEHDGAPGQRGGGPLPEAHAHDKRVCGGIFIFVGFLQWW